MLTIILPCYNPSNGWDENILLNYKEIVNSIAEEVEVILVNDGSKEPIQMERLQNLSSCIPNFHFINNKDNNGKGHAIRCGMELAKGDYIIYTDIDFPYSVGSIVSIYKELTNGSCDIAAGIKNNEYYDNVPISRRVISKGLQLCTKVLLSLPISDTQCGLKGFKKQVKPVFLQTTINRYLFDIEFLRNAYKKNYVVSPVPVILNDNVVFRSMSYKILFPEILNFLKLLFK